MQALAYPFRIDLDGHVAVTDQYPELCRGQLISVLMTNAGERIMRPDFGCNMQKRLFEGSDELVRSDAANRCMADLQFWAPRVMMEGLMFTRDRMKPGALFVDEDYRAGPLDQVRTLKMPTLAMIDQESPL